jgi:hypothetical protein
VVVKTKQRRARGPSELELVVAPGWALLPFELPLHRFSASTMNFKRSARTRLRMATIYSDPVLPTLELLMFLHPPSNMSARRPCPSCRAPPSTFHLAFVAWPTQHRVPSARALEPGPLVPPLSMRRPHLQADPLLPTRPAAFSTFHLATVASVDSVLQQKLESEIRIFVVLSPEMLSPFWAFPLVRPRMTRTAPRFIVRQLPRPPTSCGASLVREYQTYRISADANK